MVSRWLGSSASLCGGRELRETEEGADLAGAIGLSWERPSIANTNSER